MVAELRPEIRANWTRLLLENYDRHLFPEDRRAVLDAIGRETLEQVEEAGPLAWLPAEIHVRICGASYPVLGAAAFRKLWRTMTNESFDRPLFRGLLLGQQKLFGKTPAHVLRLLPGAWSLIARNAGEFEVSSDSDARTSVVVWQRIPRLFRTTEMFPLAWQGALESSLATSNLRGDAEMDLTALSSGRVTYTVTWL